jgi:CRISPR-associated protein Cmr1
MQPIIFTCETITPMFLNGANGDNPELRAPSIKGAMRFWWRAINGHLSLQELKDKEGKIFGNTEGKSCFSIQVHQIPLSIIQEKPVSHKNYTKPAVNSRFRFNIQFRLFQVKEDFNCQQLENLYILTTALGGLGGRSRRGFGSISIIEKDGKPFLNMPHTYDKLLETLNSIANYFHKDKDRIISKFPKTHDYPYIKQIQIGDRQSNLTRKISDVTHELKEQEFRAYESSLGHARHRERWASPIYVSIIKNEEGHTIPIITTLNSVPASDAHKISLTLQETFKNKIL